MNKLNKGDVIYVKYYRSFHSKQLVERVTATQAVLDDGTRVFRQYPQSGYLKVIGSYHSGFTYFAVTETNRESHEKQEADEHTASVANEVSVKIRDDYRAIGIERLERIQAIINEKTTNRE